MKKKVLQFAICLMGVSNGLLAQQWLGSSASTGNIYRDGSVSIGTTFSAAKFRVIQPIVTNGVSTIGLLGYSDGNDGAGNRSFVFQQMGDALTATQYFFLNGGLGTSSSLGSPKLTSAYANSFGFESSDNSLSIITSANGTNVNAIRALTVAPNGNIGIGTTSTGSFKLAVDGKIGAREVRVTLTNPWPDYVFANNYNLRSLSSLEEFIRKNNHLPNMPSAAAVKENGIEVGAMNAKLLEKVEELTLYIIEMDKKLKEVQKDNADLRSKLKN